MTWPVLAVWNYLISLSTILNDKLLWNDTYINFYSILILFRRCSSCSYFLFFYFCCVFNDRIYWVFQVFIYLLWFDVNWVKKAVCRRCSCSTLCYYHLLLLLGQTIAFNIGPAKFNLFLKIFWLGGRGSVEAGLRNRLVTFMSTLHF